MNKTRSVTHCAPPCATVRVCGEVMLTYLVACFVRLLHEHPPLVVVLHGHAAAAVGVFARPAEELLQLAAQRRVGVAARLGVARA